jgi:hypothetical protein
MAAIPECADLTAKSTPEAAAAAAAASDTTALDAPRPSMRTHVHRPLMTAIVAMALCLLISFSCFLSARLSAFARPLIVSFVVAHRKVQVLGSRGNEAMKFPHARGIGGGGGRIRDGK